jgi:succinate dehydrogenase / fumarate reductase cytochrome b subunit
MISPTVFYLIITGFIGAFKEYSDAVALFGTDLNAAKMNTIVGYIYDMLYGNSGGYPSYASAAAILLFAIILTIQNKKARGTDAYAVTNKPEKVEWYSQNMFLLGVIVVLGLCLHLYNFWYNMMWSELMGNAYTQLPSPSDGYAWIEQTFAQPVFVVLYVIWLCAIWFHINHGFWSAIQTLGWSGKIWLNRWQCIGFWWSTIVILMFFAVLVKFAFFA